MFNKLSNYRGGNTMKIIDAIYKSSGTGREVLIDAEEMK